MTCDVRRSPCDVRRSPCDVLLLTLPSFQVPQELRRDLNRTAGQREGDLDALRLEVPSVYTIEQRILSFHQRAEGDLDKQSEGTWAKSTEALGEVTWRRCGRFANLIAKLEIVGRRSGLNKCVHFFLESRSELPSLEIFEPPDSHAQRTGIKRTTARRTAHGERRTVL